MAIAPYQSFEDFIEANPVDNSSSRVYTGKPPVQGLQGPPGPPGPAGTPTASKSVKAYGAVGNGTVDDTDAIEDAIAAAAASVSQRNVFFPPGLYKITRALTIPPGVTFWGAGRLISMLVAGAPDISLVKFVATVALHTGFAIKDLGFTAGAYANVVGVDLNGVDSSKRLSIIDLSDLYMSCGIGIYLRFCANVSITNCFANVCTTGFRLDNVADSSLYGCHAQNGPGYGYLIEGGPGAFDEGNKLTNCTTNGQAYGISVIGQDWGQIVGCSFTTCPGGSMAFANAKNWRISTTDIASANPAAGLVADLDCRNIQVSECYVALNTFGIVLSGSLMSIKGCHFQANSNVDIFVLATNSVVAGNVCDSTTNTISIIEAPPANYNAISGNVTNGTINDVGASTLKTGNVVY